MKTRFTRRTNIKGIRDTPDIARILESLDPTFRQQTTDTLDDDSMEIGNILNREICRYFSKEQNMRKMRLTLRVTGT